MRYYVRIPKHSPPPTQTPQSQPQPPEPKVDEEGLLLPPSQSYDVILIGTGLIQSILASALSRVGLSILHCDGNDFYGELDGIWNVKDDLKTWMMNQQHGGKKKEEEDGRKNKDIKVYPHGSLSHVKIHSCTDLSCYSSSPSLSEEEIKEGTVVSTPYGPGTVLSSTTTSTSQKIKISLHNWKLANNTNATAYLSSTSPAIKVIPPPLSNLQKLYNKKRNFHLDITPGLLYASCNAVQGILNSGIGDYLEFKSLLGLLLLTEDDDNGKKNTKRSRGAKRAKQDVITKKSYSNKETKQDETETRHESIEEEKKEKQKKLKIMRVPCSKNDVFSTRLLSPSEKRKLMKFLQLALDYAHASKTTQENNDDDNEKEEKEATITSKESTTSNNISIQQEEYVTSLNERQLNQGRSLSRPQNKVLSSKDLSILLQFIQENSKNFDKYLKQVQKLDGKLRDIVIYALCLGSFSSSSDEEENNNNRRYTVEQGMNDLCHHLLSLGRYGNTAFLCPLYGCGELSQAFCRSAAVHGGIYLLRRSARQILVRKDKKEEEVYGIVLGGDNATLDENGLDMFGGSVVKEDKVIYGRNVIVAKDSVVLPSSSNNNKEKKATTSRRILRRISILKGKLIPSSDSSSRKDNEDSSNDDKEQRYIIVITPQSGNLKNENVIHGVAIDESVFVSPSPSFGNDEEDGYTVLHLTTTVECQINQEEEENGEEVIVDDSVLERAVQSLMDSRKKGDGTNTIVEELYHVSFSYPDLDDDDENKEEGEEKDGISSSATIKPKGLHICHRPSQTITVDAAFREAERIFYNICPSSSKSKSFKFLVRSEEIDKEVQERVGNVKDVDDDDEGMMLESALNMIGSVGGEEKGKEGEGGDGDDHGGNSHA